LLGTCHNIELSETEFQELEIVENLLLQNKWWYYMQEDAND
jgi:hypothetical protein